MTGVVLNIPGLPGETGRDWAPQSVSVAAACSAVVDGEAGDVAGRSPNSGAAAEGNREGAAEAGGLWFDLASEFRCRDPAGHVKFSGSGISAWSDVRGANVVHAMEA